METLFYSCPKCGDEADFPLCGACGGEGRQEEFQGEAPWGGFAYFICDTCDGHGYLLECLASPSCGTFIPGGEKDPPGRDFEKAVGI